MSGLFWNDYPYTDFHELNLSFLIKKMIELNETVKNFVSLNTIKYADPIQWNIASQYEKNTVVVDPQTGTAYLSVAPVPSGVALTNPDYWTVIFDLDIAQANNNITLRDDGNNVLSTFTSVEGDWLLWNGTLYRVTQAIGLSQAYVPGYNIERYTVELFVRSYVGVLSNLATTEKSNLVGAINELYSMIATLSPVPVKIFDSVSDLRSSTDLLVGDYVKTLGYYTPNDGGGLEFVCVDNTNSTYTDNNGTIINVGTISCINKDKILNVKAFGAQTGTDASDAINATIDNAETIIINNSYTCDDSIVIKSNKTITGGGSITFDADIANATVQRFNPSIIDVYDCVNTTVKDLTITFNVLSHGSMFRLENCSHLTFKDLTLRFNGTPTCVSINAMFDLHNDNHYITVEGCDIALTNAYGTHGGFMWVQYANINEPTVVRKSSDHVVIKNNKISSSAHDEILAIYSYYANESAIISEIDVRNNTFIRPTGSDNAFMLTVFSATDHGVKNVNIDGNHFIMESTTATVQRRVICIDGGAEHNAIVEGVTITNNLFEGYLYDIGIVDSPFAPRDSRAVITNNIIRNTATTNTTYPAFQLNNMTAVVTDNMVDGYDIIQTSNSVTNGFYVKNQTPTGMKTLYGDTDNGAIQFMNNDVFAWQTFNITAVGGASEVVEFTQTPVYWGVPTGRPIACWSAVNNNMVVRTAIGSYKKVTVFNFSATAGSVKIFVYIPQPV